MKRALALLLVLAGCGGQAKPHAPAVKPATGEVTYCDNADNQAERDAVTRFNADRSALHVTYYGEAKGHACDLFNVPDSSVALWARDGAALDITSYVQGRRAEFFPALLRTMHYAGRDWGLPRTLELRVLYLRGTPAPKTWQDLYSTAGEGGVYFSADDLGVLSAFLELAYAAGGRVLTPDGLHSALDSAANRRALDLMRASFENGGTLKDVLDHDLDAVSSAFQSGYGTYMLNWVPESPLKPDAGGRQLTIAALPAFAGGRRATLVESAALVVNRHARNRDGALRLLDYLTHPPALRAQAADHGLLSPLRALYREPGYKAPGVDVARASMAFAQTLPVTPAIDAVEKAIARNVQAALRGETTTADALSEASAEIDRALAGVAPGRVN